MPITNVKQWWGKLHLCIATTFARSMLRFGRGKTEVSQTSCPPALAGARAQLSSKTQMQFFATTSA